MQRIISYLTFNGNCREAMSFYQKCLGGKVTFQTVGETPMASKLPQKMQDCILHSTLTNGSFVLMGTDMPQHSSLVKGNSVSLMLQCNSEKEIKEIYAKLSKGGEKHSPVSVTFWGSLSGDLTDRYGHHWILNLPTIKSTP